MKNKIRLQYVSLILTHIEKIKAPAFQKFSTWVNFL